MSVNCGSLLSVSRSALASNIQVFRSVCGEAQLGVVLKANGYGHGLLEVLSVVHSLVDVVFVIEASDALSMRRWEEEQGFVQRRVVVLGHVDVGHFELLCDQNIEVALGNDSLATKSAEFLSGMAKFGHKKLKVHLQLDTGLGREGYLPHEVGQRYSFLEILQHHVQVCGFMSHFANTEDVTEQQYAEHQLAAFDQGKRAVLDCVPHLATLTLEDHFAASAAALVLPPARKNILRVGISMYGLWPSSETKISAKIALGAPPKLRPALRWTCRSQVVKPLPAGEFVGYGCTWKAAHPTRIAVFPVGYFDGYSRALSGKAHVLVKGQRAPVVGRVMMNHIVVDVGHVVSNDDPIEATLLGSDGSEQVSAENLAAWSGTIPYEIVARLGGHLARTVVP
jgi:alanine racemase